jgi:signal transduction histidine kinase
VAHHVNNALTGVIANLEMALRLAMREDELTRFLRGSLACALRAADAVKRIVAFSCRKQHAPTLATLSLRQIADAAVQALRARCGAGIRVRVEGDTHEGVSGNELLLRNAIDLLLDNAVEALSGEGTIVLTVEDYGNQRCLRIRDTGSGLTAEAAARLFEPFFTTKSAGHLGVGLVVCRELIEAQGGRIHIRSRVGHGTTVTLSFPSLKPAVSGEGVPPRRDKGQTTSNPHWLSPRVAAVAQVSAPISSS